MKPGPIKGLGAMMRLKAWFTLEDAAKYLSVVFDTDVSTADVLRFALDGHLKLSVRFVNEICARRYLLLTAEELRMVIARMEEHRVSVEAAKASGEPLPPFRLPAQPPELIREREKARELLFLSDEVFDLPLEGGERLDVEHEYQRLTDGPEVEGISLDEVFIETADGERLEMMTRFDASDSTLARGYSPEDFHPAGTLGAGAVFVVRTSALRALELALGGEPPEGIDSKPMMTRERSTLLVLIAALAEHSRIDISKPAKAAERLEALTVQKGARVASRTILEHLRKVPDALERMNRD